MIKKISGGCSGKSKKKVKSCDDANISIKGTCEGKDIKSADYPYDDELNFSDWSFDDVAEFVAKNFDSITGRPIEIIYNPPGGEYEETLIFDQDIIDETHPALDEFLRNHTDWDDRKIEDFWYHLDDYLTMNYDTYAPGIDAACDVKAAYSGHDVYSWLSQHRQQCEDCEYELGVYDIHDVPHDKLLDWIYNHPQLWTDFTANFPEDAKEYVGEENWDYDSDEIDAACDVKSAYIKPYHPENPEYVPYEDDLDYYGGSAETGEFKDIDILESEAVFGSDEYELYNWLGEHEQACDDCCNFFDVAELDSIPIEDILGWIYDHGQLWTDFTSRFPEEARWFVEDVIGNPWDDESEPTMFQGAPVAETTDIYGSGEDIDYRHNLKILTQLIMEKLEYEGYIPDRDYAEGAAELLLMGDEPVSRVTVSQWFDDTMTNYPEDLENLKGPAFQNIECSYPEDYMLNGSEQYAAQEAMEALDSGDEDDIETAVSYAVNLVNNANAEADYEDEDFYMEEADYNTVLQYVKQKRGKGVESCDTVMAADIVDDADYLDDLGVAVEDSLVEKGYSSVVSILPNGYLEVQLYPEDEEEFEYGEALYTYLTDIDSIDANDDEIEIIADQIASDAVKEYEYSYEDSDFEDDYTEIESKQVLDSDGFYTDYTMYRDDSDGTYFFMFGDKDLYPPDKDFADWECETEEEAYEWFDSYKGFDED